MDFLYFLGRLHPLILHLPIGFLTIVLVLEWASRKEAYQNIRPAIPYVLLLTMLTAVPAAFFGYFLSLEGGYDGNLLSWHKWSGITVAVLSVALYFFKTKDHQFYYPTLILSAVALLVAGHYGGTLTHGNTYLTEYAPGFIKKIAGFSESNEEVVIENLDSAIVYDAFIQPILEKKCVNCHNPGKLKGDLALDTREGIEKGGENGPVLVAHSALNSHLINRILLPEEDELHMPPSGRQQITPGELALLQWWIDSGVSFEQKVAETEVPKGVKGILDALTNQPKGVFALDIDPVGKNRFMSILEAGIPIQPLSRSSPLLEVDLSFQDSLTNDQFRMLRRARKQIFGLDLSHSNVNDDLLESVRQFPHLSELDLNHTQVSDDGLKNLENLEYLEYLNLYATPVTDAGLQALYNLKSLRSLFVWQTGITEEGIAKLKEKLPALEVITGMENDTAFQAVQLMPPTIMAEEELFSDSVEVSLELNFGGVDIRYTVDGTEPDSTSLPYTDPIVLKETTDLKAVAFKEDWEASEPVAKQFIKVNKTPVAVRISSQPNSRYAADGAKSLIDHKKGSDQFQDGSWMGWEKEHLTATFDLGEPQRVSTVTVGALENTGSWIFFPAGLRVWVSNDGNKFKEVARRKYPTAEEPLPAEKRNFIERFEPTKARYVRVKVESNLLNPSWHPGAGEPCWLFIDEIILD